MNFLESFWNDILSRQPERIRHAFLEVDAASQQNVLQHLGKMSREEGWLPEQRLSAQSALDALQDLPSKPPRRPRHRKKPSREP